MAFRKIHKLENFYWYYEQIYGGSLGIQKQSNRFTKIQVGIISIHLYIEHFKFLINCANSKFKTWHYTHITTLKYKIDFICYLSRKKRIYLHLYLVKIKRYYLYVIDVIYVKKG